MASAGVVLPLQAVLIGIDAYVHAPPLGGCANDVDAVESFLAERLGASVHKHVARAGQPAPGDRPATLAAIREALARLATEVVTARDRVLIWYSGHGVQVRGRPDHDGREALVPADFGPGVPPLWDVELNRALHAIAARTPHLTVVLDCCCSAGAFRGLGTPRTFSPGSALDLPEAAPGVGLLRHLAGGSFSVAAAAQADQSAQEVPFGDRRHGAFTRALLDALAAVEPEALPRCEWGRIWQRVLAGVAAVSSGQDPVLIGRFERPVFGGSWAARDAGFAVRGDDGGFAVGAGKLAGIAPGALVGVYAAEVPSFFPLVGTPDDLSARIGTIRIVSADEATARGEPTAPFDVPEGARGRLVEPGEPDRLRVHTEDAGLSALIPGMPGIEPAPADAEIEIGRDAQGIWLGDAWFRPGGLGPLARAASEVGLRAALDHARAFVAPLRLAARARDLPGALALSLRDGATPEGGSEILRDPDGPHDWRLPEGQPFALEIANTSAVVLYVSVLNCASSGRVELLADAVEIPPGERQIVWASEQVGRSFVAINRPDRPVGLERIVLVGTTRSGTSLRAFEEIDTFADVIERGSVERELISAAPVERWTARVLAIRIERGGGRVTSRAEAQKVALPELLPYERSEADPDSEIRDRDATLPLPFAFDDAWLIPVEPGQAVGVGWLARWGARPLGVTWHWGATPSLRVLSETLGGANASRKGEASAHYGVGRRYVDGVHRYVALENRSWHAGRQQVTRWDGRALAVADEKATRTTIGVETDHRGHVPAATAAPADWVRMADSLGDEIKVQPWTEEQIDMMIAVGREIQATWPHLGPRGHHGHSDLCPGYKVDVTGFPFARVLRGIYDDPALPDVWTPFHTLIGRQRAFELLGYDLGPSGVDGVWGRMSREALARLKREAGLRERERSDDPVGGHWNTFVGWALFDRFAVEGIDWALLLA